MRPGALVLATILTLSAGLAHAQAGRVVDTEAPAEPAAAPAAATPEDEAVAGAREALTEAMGFYEKAKWKEFKTRIHPYTAKVMEERKTRTKRDDHNLSFWTHIKEWKIKTWDVTTVEAGPRGSAVVQTREDHFLVEEKGLDENKEVEWLLVKGTDPKDKNRWLILDRKNGTGNFSGTSVEKGYGDALLAAAAGPAKAPSNPRDAYVQKLEKVIRTKLKVPEDIPENQLKVMSCGVKIMVDEGGGILSRVVEKASGNPAYDKAIIRAIDAAQPLPAPDNAVVEEAKSGVVVTFKGKPAA